MVAGRSGRVDHRGAAAGTVPRAVTVTHAAPRAGAGARTRPLTAAGPADDGVPRHRGPRVLRPEQRVLLIAGDGAFGLNGMEMETAVRFNLPMTVVQSDGNDVEPVTVDEFRIGVAETYDVIVEPQDNTAYTIFAQAQDRTGYDRATLAPRIGMTAEVPTDPRPDAR